MKEVRHIFFAQTLLVVLSAAIAWKMLSLRIAYSIGLGGLVYLLPSMFFAKKLFRGSQSRTAKQIMANAYQGEALKMISAACLFALVFYLTQVQALAFFMTYCGMYVVVWWALFYFRT